MSYLCSKKGDCRNLKGNVGLILTHTGFTLVWLLNTAEATLFTTKQVWTESSLVTVAVTNLKPKRINRMHLLLTHAHLKALQTPKPCHFPPGYHAAFQNNIQSRGLAFKWWSSVLKGSRRTTKALSYWKCRNSLFIALSFSMCRSGQSLLRNWQLTHPSV